MLTEHHLDAIHEFTHRTVGWETLPEGGKVPIIEKLTHPYFRYYCACGTVGTAAASYGIAMQKYKSHKGDVR